MKRRTVLIALLVVIALGGGLGLWAASWDNQGAACIETTFTVPGTERPNMMTYHRTVCGDEPR